MLGQGRWLYLYFNHWQTTLVSVSECLICLIVLFAMMMTYSIKYIRGNSLWPFFSVGKFVTFKDSVTSGTSSYGIKGSHWVTWCFMWLTRPHPLKMLFVFVFVGWIFRKQLDFRLVSYYSLYTNMGTIWNNNSNNDNHDDDGLMMAVILLVLWILLNTCVNIEYTYIYDFISYTNDIICARV